MILYKDTVKLFQGKYQYKIVLICTGVGVFRGNDLDRAFVKLSNLSVETNTIWKRAHLLTQKDIDYLFDVYQTLRTIDDFKLRVESPWLSIYLKDETDLIKIKNINKDRVKLIYQPKVSLQENEIVSTLPFDYKVSIKTTKQGYNAFVDWAKQFDTIRLTNSCTDILKNGRNYSSGSYFYVRGEKTLTMTKLHLGNLIRKVEKIVNLD